jgi:subtilisin family serine protease
MRKVPLRRLVAGIAVAATVLVSGQAAARADQAKARVANSAYIVQLADAPVTAYRGGIAGLQATAPNRGQKIDPNHPHVVAYLAYLNSRQDQVLNGVGGGRKLYNYGYAFNGFAAELTAEQASKLARAPGVLAVSKDEARALDTSSTPGFLGLPGAAGVWATQAKGEGVIIGIIDGGIWPESLSFSDRTGSNGNASKDGKLDYQQIPGWNGKCIPGEAFNASHCNHKLIGARYYNSGWGGNAGIDEQLPWEYNSPRDFGGHGTHVASTAGGNANTPTNGPAAVFGPVSGIAPRARIAAYKVCWETGAGGSCFNSDSVAAIDQAVADGVDVINFSISGTRTNFRDPVEIAFLFAADAGVFVAASAGNSGPTASTVAHPSPWLTTVAAGTHNRAVNGSVTLGNGATYFGASVASAVGPKPLINASAAGLPGADPTAVALCFAAVDNGGTPVLDPAKVAGKIVVCDRGVTARVNKSLAVSEAGGAGMILLNPSPNSLNGDLHAVPTVHLQNTDRAAVMAYAATAGATATINAAVISYAATAPLTASFSSRGPLLGANGDVLKPDLIAPGQDILAAVAPPFNQGKDFDIYSGTSMSSPHVAGLAALLKEKYPHWSPMAIKSALMTTGSDVLDGGTPAPNTNPVLIFRQGAGHVQPMKAFNPGLVYDSNFADWLAFICGVQPGGGCAGVTPIDASNLNQASIAIGDLAGVQTVTRKVKNVSGGALTVSASVTGMAGFTTTVTPSAMTLAAGAEGAFAVSFARTTAALNAYTGGQLTWAGSGVSVRSPIVVRPVALGAPLEVSSSGAAISYPVTFGYTGPFSAAARGLVPAAVTADSVADDPTDGACTLTSPNAKLYPVAVPAGTTYARFSLFDADVTPGADIDLCVFNSAGTLVGASGGGTSAEEVNLLSPAAGTYTVVVQGWGVVGSSPFKLHTWLLGSAAAGNMSVAAPAGASTGATGTINLTFSGLSAGTRYLGSVAYGGTTGMPNPTIVRVTP